MIIFLHRTTSDFLIKCLDEEEKVIYTPNLDLKYLVVEGYVCESGNQLSERYQSAPVYAKDLTDSFIQDFVKEIKEKWNSEGLPKYIDSMKDKKFT